MENLKKYTEFSDDTDSFAATFDGIDYDSSDDNDDDDNDEE